MMANRPHASIRDVPWVEAEGVLVAQFQMTAEKREEAEAAGCAMATTIPPPGRMETEVKEVAAAEEDTEVEWTEVESSPSSRSGQIEPRTQQRPCWVLEGAFDHNETLKTPTTERTIHHSSFHYEMRVIISFVGHMIVVCCVHVT